MSSLLGPSFLVSPTMLAARIERQAASAPGAVAVICGDASLTYRELNTRANRLARHLRSQGAGPGLLVGLGMDRGLDAAVALLAVLKSGAAYAPLDPAYPAERLAHMVTGAGIAMTATTSALAPRFRAAGAVRLIETDALPPDTFQDGEETNPEPASGPDDLFYAIFTSGSTGRPKAAGVYQRGFLNLLDWYIKEFALGAADRFLVISSLSFDLTQKNLFAPLLCGGTLVFQPPGPYDLVAVSENIRRHGITLVNCTPSAFYPLVEAAAGGGYGGLASLRFAVLGGEPISIPRLRPWLESPACRAEVANTYGPTECTDICGFHRLGRANLDCHPFVPIGRDVTNVRMAVLDDDLRPVEDGETGELCIAGAGVGAGYLGDPTRTAERFVPNPLPDDLPGATIYRSGDLARRLPDGLLEFRGRRDHQVKVRGFRIEPGEIEHALQAHPSVREAVVVVRDTGGQEARLVACVQAREGGGLDVCDLLEWLRTRLPGHMVPARLEVLERFPLTPNGKIDRLALRDREDETPPAPAPPAAAPLPHDLAGRIAAAWSEVLGRPVLDSSANFFDLGGNSLHLARLQVKLVDLLGRPFPITDLFAHPTVGAQAAHFGAPAPVSSDHQPHLDRARRQQDGLARFRRSPRP